MLPRDLRLREDGTITPSGFGKKYRITEEWVRRLGLVHELEGHQGCVNCLEWSRRGTVLASGSDDLRINLWDPFQRKLLSSFQTKHTGNIFSVKFVGPSDDGSGIVVSAAADHKIFCIDLGREETIRSFTNHFGRVKRLETYEHLVWSAGEDGLVMQMDLRCDSKDAQVLVNLNAGMGRNAEAKCLAVNPLRPESHLAVGANDCFVRIYDRRMIKPQPMPEFEASETRRNQMRAKEHFSITGTDLANCVQFFAAGHLPNSEAYLRKKIRPLTTTFLSYFNDGTEILANIGGEQIYLFNTEAPRVSLLNDSVKLESAMNKPPKEIPELSENIKAIKSRANEHYNEDRFNHALTEYNQAVHRCKRSPLLYANRAAALLKRRWEGDIYDALRNCYRAIELDPLYVKAHLRLLRCLIELERTKECRGYMTEFAVRFPDHALQSPFLQLEKDLVEFEKKQQEGGNDSHESEDENSGRPEVEALFRKSAGDYEEMYSGHCNTTTDIKEATFLGDDYVAAGSDDGRFFIWNKKSRNICTVLNADESIVNCLLLCPNNYLLATSGIDPVVRLWSPLPEGGENERKLTSEATEEASTSNQKQMNRDPIEALFMSMTYEGNRDMREDEGGNPNLQCHPS